MQTKITYWLPFGFRLTYSGAPMSRSTWIIKTFRGYVGAWQFMFRAYRIGVTISKKDGPA